MKRLQPLVMKRRLEIPVTDRKKVWVFNLWDFWLKSTSIKNDVLEGTCDYIYQESRWQYGCWENSQGFDGLYASLMEGSHLSAWLAWRGRRGEESKDSGSGVHIAIRWSVAETNCTWPWWQSAPSRDIKRYANNIFSWSPCLQDDLLRVRLAGDSCRRH